MLVFGLTGPTGAGKGAVSAILDRCCGVPAIDTDAVYHQLLLPPSACLEELAAAFGETVRRADGTLDRAALSAIVFSDATREKQTLLNRITHKYVLARTRELLAAYRRDGVCAVLVDAPLLYESGFDAECDAVIAVLAPRALRQARIIARDGLSAERAQARLDMQKPDAFYTERTAHVVINDGNMDALERQVLALALRLGVRRA